MTTSTPRSPELRIYWVETEDHLEDWFLLARDELEAERSHERSEGYDPGDAFATEVAIVPRAVLSRFDAEVGWPSLELLEACGGTILRGETPRVVTFGERTYCEGLLDAQIQEVDEALQAAKEHRRPPKPPQMN